MLTYKPPQVKHLGCLGCDKNTSSRELSLMGGADWDDQPGTFGINRRLGYARGHNHPRT